MTAQAQPAPAGRPLKVGLFLPLIEGTMAGDTASWKDLATFAQRAESLGFDSLWLPDHLIVQWGWEGSRPEGVWELWSMLSAWSAIYLSTRPK